MVTRFFKTIVIMDSKQEKAYNVHRLFSQVRGMLALADQTFLMKLAVYTFCTTYSIHLCIIHISSMVLSTAVLNIMKT